MKKIKKLQLLNVSVLGNNDLKNVVGGMNNSDDCSAPVEQCDTGRTCSGFFKGTGVCGVNATSYCVCIPGSTSSLFDE
ncbi:MAG: hypothetical protein Q4D33_07455 [Prevotellaceae bacterium]|nr:hypothetical protein [Prevotellaceae bacterium]